MAKKRTNTNEPASMEKWSAYSDNFPRHIIALSRYMQAEILSTLRHCNGYQSLSLGFEPYVALISQGDCRLSDIAQHLAITKQSCNKTVNHMEQLGLIKRVPDPHDKRAKILRITKRGKQLVADGSKAALLVEDTFASVSSHDDVQAFAHLLSELYKSLDLDYGRDHANTSPGIGTTLPRISNFIMQRIMALNEERGYLGLKVSHNAVLSLIGPDGGKLQQMADINNVSKQAISYMSNELISKGYLKRVNDKTDSRQVTFTLTQLGEQLISDSIDAIQALEKEFQALTSASHLKRLKAVAKKISTSLQLERQVFESHKRMQAVADKLKLRYDQHQLNVLVTLLQQDLEDAAS